MTGIRGASLGRVLIPVVLVVGGGVLDVPAKTESDEINEAFVTYCEHAGKDAPQCANKDNLAKEAKLAQLRMCCADSDRKPEFCKNLTEVCSKTPPGPVLVYDHGRDGWRAFDLPTGLETDVHGVPRVHLPEDDHLLVIVENTNPLLYGVEPGEVTEEDISILGDLQKLAGLAGSALASLVKEHGAVKARMASSQQRSEELERAVRDTATILENLAKERYRIIAHVQQLELGKDPGPSCRGGAAVCVAQVRDTFQALEDKYGELLETPILCKKVFEKFEAVRAAVPGQTAGTKGFRDAIEAFEVAKKDKDCGELQSTVDELTALLKGPKAKADHVVEIQVQIAALPAPDARDATQQQNAKKLQTDLLSAFSDLRDAADSGLTEETEAAVVLRIATEESEALTAAQALLAQREAPIASAANLERMYQRCESAWLTKNDEGRFSGYLVLDEQPKSKWDKVRTYELKVTTANPYGASVVAARPTEVTRKYQVAGRSGRILGVGAGMIFTSIHEPTFGGVPDPVNPGQMVVGRTEEKSRSGDLALFVNYRWLQHLKPATRINKVQPGLEFGVGLDANDTALFLGPSVQLGKWFRLGGGWTWQKTKKLDGPVEGVTVLTEGEAIPTRDGIENSWYLSLTVAFDSIKLFSAD